MKRLPPLIAAILFFIQPLSNAATFVVTSTANSGPGTLRQAILDANAAPGLDNISFNLPGSGVQTIAPTNSLPDITNAVVINGFSQPGSSANTLANGDNSVHLVRLDGIYTTNINPPGLNFPGVSSSGSVVRGLVIVRFYNAIKINEASGFTIAGNWIGMDVNGVAHGTALEGIRIDSFFNNGFNHVIGGLTPADRNVISGNRYGIYFAGATTGNSFLQGNFIGTDPTGTLPRGNLFGGVYIFSGTNITVGGAAAAARNVICSAFGAGGTGVTVQSGPNNVIQGNLIGTDVTGQNDLGNVSDGIFVTSSTGTRIIGNQIVNNHANGINLSASSTTVVENNFIGTDANATRPLGNSLAGVLITGSTNRIGGLTNGQPNTIFFNGGAGVSVNSTTAVQNEISRNAIYDNGGLGIDLTPSGISTNDVQDVDAGANGLQNFPVLTNASVAASTLTVQGSLNSKASSTYRVEFFATPTWDSLNIPEGKNFLGSTNVVTDGGGNATFTANLAAPSDAAYLITATAIDAAGNTSEFSVGLNPVVLAVSPPVLGIARGVSGANVTIIISWPTANGFALEKSPSLNTPIVWSSATNGVVTLNGTNFFTLTNSLVSANQFFRLKKP